MWSGEWSEPCDRVVGAGTVAVCACLPYEDGYNSDEEIQNDNLLAAPAHPPAAGMRLSVRFLAAGHRGSHFAHTPDSTYP